MPAPTWNLLAPPVNADGDDDANVTAAVGETVIDSTDVVEAAPTE